MLHMRGPIAWPTQTQNGPSPTGRAIHENRAVPHRSRLAHETTVFEQIYLAVPDFASSAAARGSNRPLSVAFM